MLLSREVLALPLAKASNVKIMKAMNKQVSRHFSKRKIDEK